MDKKTQASSGVYTIIHLVRSTESKPILRFKDSEFEWAKGSFVGNYLKFRSAACTVFGFVIEISFSSRKITSIQLH